MFAKTRAVAQKYGAKVSAAILTAGASVASMAQTTDPFTDAMSTLTTKVTTYGGALVALSAVGVGFFVAMKYVKKIPRAA